MIRDSRRLNLKVTDLFIVSSNDKVKNASQLMGSFIYLLTQTELRENVTEGDGISVSLIFERQIEVAHDQELTVSCDKAFQDRGELIEELSCWNFRARSVNG